MPEKPELFVLMGYGWAATTPLWRTLRGTRKFFTGINKEPYYSVMWWYHQLGDRERCDQYRKRIEHSINVLSKGAEYSDYLRELLDTFPGGPEKIRSLLLEGEPSVQRYIKYYKNCYKGSQKKLLDFSVPNIWMEEPYFSKFWGNVAVAFDLKFITIVRDPVRRHYSEFSGQYFNGWEAVSGCENDLNKKLSLKDFLIERARWDENRNYIDKLEMCQKVAPTLMLVMEDLWSDWSKLESFVGEDIPELFPNVYWPDRGKDRIKHPKLEDQWCTDRITITQDIYDALYEMLEDQYTRWKERFGKLPTGWGRMVDYKNAPPVPSWNHPNVDSLYL